MRTCSSLVADVPASPVSPSSGENALSTVATGLRAWAIEAALPFWHRRGVDRRLGGFFERLHLDGSPDRQAVRRTVAQARQIYVYARAASLGWYPEGLQVALDGLQFLQSHARAPDGGPGYIHLIAPDGSIGDGVQDTYDHAFIVLALAWLAKASGDRQVHALLSSLLVFFDEHLMLPDGSLKEGIPSWEPHRQNPHMHLFEAMLALHETGADTSALSRAARLRHIFETRFLDPESATITEYFTASWKPWPGETTIEPGHHAEWAWLLRQHDALTGAIPTELPRRLLEIARRSADPVTSLIPDTVRADGQQPSETCRLWPQTEYARAWLTECYLDAGGAAPHAAAALQNLHDRYLIPALPGGWLDTLDNRGYALPGHMPASSFYHLFGMVVEADRVRSNGAAT